MNGAMSKKSTVPLKSTSPSRQLGRSPPARRQMALLVARKTGLSKGTTCFLTLALEKPWAILDSCPYFNIAVLGYPLSHIFR